MSQVDSRTFHLALPASTVLLSRAVVETVINCEDDRGGGCEMRAGSEGGVALP